MESEFINCPNCGTRNFRSHVYCGACKTLLISDSDQDANNLKPSTKAAKRNRTRKNHEQTPRETAIGCGTLLIIIAIIIGVCNRGDDDKNKNDNKESEPKVITLNASVSFTGTQFVITNNDNFDYFYPDFHVNTYYSLKADVILAHHTYSVGLMQFANIEGKRFTFEDKPQSFDIWCQMPNKEIGIYDATFY